MFGTFNLKLKDLGKNLDELVQNPVTESTMQPIDIPSASESLLDVKQDEDIEAKKGPRANDKSKRGCLTCKYRKKKCDETKPVCRDCLRFGKECVWVDHTTMSTEQIRELRMKVKAQESNNKIRKRRRVAKKSEKPLSNDERDNDVPFNEIDDDFPINSSINDNKTDNHNFATTDIQSANMNEASMPLNGFHPVDPTMQIPSQNTFDNTMLLSIPPMPASQMPAINGTTLPQTLEMNPVQQSSYPLELSLCRDGTEHPPGSPMAFLSLYGELSSYMQETPPVQDSTSLVKQDYDNNNAHTRRNRELSIPDFLEQINRINVESPAQLGLLASNFNAVLNPSPVPPPSVLPELDSSGQYLFNYYVNTLSQKVSIAPESQNESNSYQKVFLPLAQRDQAVLFGLLAWAGFHLGGHWLNEASKYAEAAVKLLCKGIDFSGKQPATQGDRNTILNKLAALLILCGAEICRGDVKYWCVYHKWAWRLLKDNGGILNFDTNKEEHWLITNFAYHDVMASSTSERGTYFSPDTYQTIFKDPEGVSRGNLSPLLGVSKTLYRYIAEITSLSHRNNKKLNEYYNRCSPKTSPESFDGNYASAFDEHSQSSVKPDSVLLAIVSKAEELEAKIDNAKPDPEDFLNLSKPDLELQLTIFEAFQLSCKLFLRQSIFKCNPSSLVSQVVVNNLLECIDVLIKTPVQATLVFPLFIAGIHLVTDYDRELMRSRLDQMIRTYGPWNVVRVKHLMEEVWDRNPHGDSVVDWLAILKDLKWEVNFA